MTELPDSTKGEAKGYVLVRGAWAGLLEHPERPFSPNHSLELPGKSVLRGLSCLCLVDPLVVFARWLNTFGC